jgi:PIN domain nuclease of toxin-antitoxin system
MNYLVDTQLLLWTFFEPGKIRPAVREVFLAEEGNVFYNPASLWEISIKYGLGKLNLWHGITPEGFLANLDTSFFICKPLDNGIIASAHRLPRLHGDPFDRLIIWDAMASGFTLISDDSYCRQYKQFGLLLL